MPLFEKISLAWLGQDYKDGLSFADKLHYPNQPNLTPPLPQPNLDLNSSCIVSSWKVTFHSKISMTLIAMLSLLIIKTYTWTLISTSNMNLNLNLDLNITFTWVPWLIISVQQANKCLIWLYKREVKVHLKKVVCRLRKAIILPSMSWPPQGATSCEEDQDSTNCFQGH